MPWFVGFATLFNFHGVAVTSAADLSQDVTECEVRKRCRVTHQRDTAVLQKPQGQGQH